MFAYIPQDQNSKLTKKINSSLNYETVIIFKKESTLNKKISYLRSYMNTSLNNVRNWAKHFQNR